MSKGRPLQKPSVYDDEVVAELVLRIAMGRSINKTLDDPDMPSRYEFWARMNKDQQFQTIIARAREIQQDSRSDEIVDIADAATPEDHHVARLRIWARQWDATKLAPKKYGDRQTVDHTGTITLESLVLEAHRSKAKGLPDIESKPEDET